MAKIKPPSQVDVYNAIKITIDSLLVGEKKKPDFCTVKAFQTSQK